MDSRKISLTHDWLVQKGGAEGVLSSLLDIWGDVPIYTMVYDAQGPCKDFFIGRTIEASFLQRLPSATKRYRSFLPLMPLAVEQLDLNDYSLIISSSYSFTKGIITGPDQLHICYLHSPVRYAWDLQHQYLRETGLHSGVKSWLVKIVLHYIRLWDQHSANRVDYFVANSHFVARRIWKAYRREATVIYPPVDVTSFVLQEKKDDYYLAISRLVPYKKMSLIINAFTLLPDKELIVIGDGPLLEILKSRSGKNVKVLGYQSKDTVVDYMQRAKALIFAAMEDFGIVPVEAQACGTPVIAYGKGGALETVIEGETGLFFYEQTVDALVDAVNRFESGEYTFSPQAIRKNAERFSKERFQQEFIQFVEEKWGEFQHGLPQHKPLF